MSHRRRADRQRNAATARHLRSQIERLPATSDTRRRLAAVAAAAEVRSRQTSVNP